MCDSQLYIASLGVTGIWVENVLFCFLQSKEHVACIQQDFSRGRYPSTVEGLGAECTEGSTSQLRR